MNTGATPGRQWTIEDTEMPEYMREKDGVVHVMESGAGHEFTYCNRPTDGDEQIGGGFYGSASTGPATCQKCRHTIAVVRASIKGVRFVKNDE